MTDQADALNVLFTEFYYWVTVVIMFLIHVGFCLYEVGVSREKNKLNTLMKNSMLIPVITFGFFLVGWWLYFAMQNGPGITGGLKSAPWQILSRSTSIHLSWVPCGRTQSLTHGFLRARMTLLLMSGRRGGIWSGTGLM